MKRHQESGPGYRPDIDGLRAIAVVSVVLYHVGLPGFSGGYAGVDVFFVISGYLISGIIWRDLGRGRFSLMEFYGRRVRRILPALFAVLLACSIAALFVLTPAELIAFGKSLNATVLFHSNFQQVKVGYFDGAAIDKPLLHTWSLSVEEQFYAIWPMLLLAMARFMPRKQVVPALLAIAAISLLLAQLRLGAHAKDSFYLTYYRMWELALGGALAIAPPFLLNRRHAAAAAALGLSAIVGTIVFYDITTPFPGLTALLPCLGAVFLIGAGSSPNAISSGLGLAPFRFTGLISYSLYLIHWPLISFTHLYLYDALSFSLRLLVVLASFGLAYLSWRYVETPFRERSSGNTVAVLRGVGIAGAFAVAGTVFIQQAGFPSRADETVLAAEKVAAENTAGVAKGLGYPKYCRPVSIEGIKGGGACEFGTRSERGYDIVLWGDSHASHFVPSISILAEQNGVSGIAFASLGCPPFLGDADVLPGCRPFNQSVAGWIAQQKTLRSVLLASRWVASRAEFDRASNLPDGQNSGGLAPTLAMLAKLKVAAVVMGQAPEFDNDVPACLAHSKSRGEDKERCTAQPVEAVSRQFEFANEYFRRLQSQFGITVVNPLPAFCDHQVCRAMLNGVIFMTDRSHLSEAGALHAVPYLQIPGLSYHPAETVADAGTGPYFVQTAK